MSDDYVADAEVPCCPDCGSVAVRDLIDGRDKVIADLERELRGKRALIGRLKADAAERQENHPYYEEAVEVFNYWKSKLAPRAREFTGDRFDKVAARLNAGATVAELKLAIDGCAVRPYVLDRGGRSHSGFKDQRNVELELICRSEAHVLRFIGYAEGEAQRKEAEAARTAENASVADYSPQDYGKLREYREALSEPAVRRLGELRGWTPEAIRKLGLGLDGDRVTIPVRDAVGALVGLHRYQPNPDKRGDSPKMLGEGQRDLFPAPESMPNATIVWLVEGEPDAVSMRSMGLPAVGVPGVATWKDGWTQRFAAFDRVLIAFDCDEPGRKAADKLVGKLAEVTSASVVELDPDRDDGYDVSDVLIEYGDPAAAGASLARRAMSKASTVTGIRLPRPSTEDDADRDPRPPYDKITQALEERDCRVTYRQPGHATAQCPVHDDRVPSLSISEGDDGRVLFNCHAGCDPDEVVAALGFEWPDLFPDERTG